MGTLSGFSEPQRHYAIGTVGLITFVMWITQGNRGKLQGTWQLTSLYLSRVVLSQNNQLSEHRADQQVHLFIYLLPFVREKLLDNESLVAKVT